MNAPTHDPWQDRLSEYLDGELDAETRTALEAHLGGCAACRALLAELGAVVAAARTLGVRPPERDLWPGVAAALEPRRSSRDWPRWTLAFAAGVVLALGVMLVYEARERAAPARRVETRVAANGERYLLLLHEPEGFGNGASSAEHAAVVERYARWAGELGDRCLGGEELAETGEELFPGASEPLVRSGGARIGGYFLLAVHDLAEAVALARGCPHLAQGGSIEIRRIRTENTENQR